MPLTARQFVFAAGTKGLTIPKDGWTADSFAEHGTALLKTIVRVGRITQLKAAPVIARAANKVFRKQLDMVIARVHGRLKTAQKDPAVELMFPQHEALWSRALEDVFRETGMNVAIEMLPPIQSTMDQAYSKMGILLGEESDPRDNPRIGRDARGLAERITGINHTTRRQFDRIVRDSISNGLTVSQTSQALQEQLPAL